MNSKPFPKMLFVSGTLLILGASFTSMTQLHGYTLPTIVLGVALLVAGYLSCSRWPQETQEAGLELNFVLFLGAGASAEFGIPLFSELARDFLKEPLYYVYRNRIKIIKQEFARVGFKPNIENYISFAKGQLKPKKTLLKMNPFISHFVYSSTCKKLGYNPSANRFINDLEEYVYDKLFVHEYETMREILRHYDDFFKVMNEKYHGGRDFNDFKVDIFTTNYDNVIEEYSEERGFDAFDGYAEKPDGMSYFAPELYDIHQIRLYKLHGSVRLGIVVEDNTNNMGIVHSKRRTKIGGLYRNNWKIAERIMLLGFDKDVSKDPYFELLKILKEKLMVTKTCIVIGYSFNDGPILNIFKDVLKRRGEDFKLILLSKNAGEIKSKKFSDDDRIQDLDGEFSDFRKI